MSKFPTKKWKDILQIVSGKNQKAVEDANGPYPIYGSGGKMGTATQYLCEAGTTIIGRKGTINRPIFVNQRFWNVDTAFGLSAGKDLTPRFLYFFCQLFNFNELDKSTTIPSLAKRDLEQIQMPVPPLPEQERIVSRIEELFSRLDAAVAELQTVKEKLNVYRQSILVNAFNSLPDFQETVLGELLIEKPRNGFSPKGVNHETKYRNLTLSATTGGTFRDGFFKYIDINIEKSSHLWVKKQDILIQRANTIDYVGTAAIYTGEDDQYVYPDLMMKCHVKQGINPFFVLHQLHLKRTQKYYRDNATGTAGNMPKINQETVMKTPVLITDRQSQDIVVDLIEKHLAVCQDNEVSILRCMQQASALRQSILKQAFEGNL